ncbi:MAG: hypothetical protein QG614_259 [Patescibacteria group bacterium]|nr:hypothetical protein [Patescibacteria group bacterium]
MLKNLFKKIIINIITWQAKQVLKKHNPMVIGITGNIGKTSTKDSIAVALQTLSVRENKKSLNSEFGVPLTVLNQKTGWNSIIKWSKVILAGFKEIRTKDYPKILILEIGADHKGDIKNLMKWLKLDIAVMTQFAEVPVHIENFDSKEQMLKEKSYIVKGLKKGGIFIFNADCEDCVNISKKVRDDVKTISFGEKTGDCRANMIINDIKNKNVHSQINYNNKKYNLICNSVIGNASILAAMPAIIIADHYRLNLPNVVESLKDMERAPGRMRLLEGKGGSVILDDSYNSSPLALMNGLKTLNETNVIGRKIVILGDMLELGEFTRQEHYKMGSEVKRVAHVLVTVGSRAKFIAEGARDAGMEDGWILECSRSDEAGKEVLSIIKSGDLVYIKGSQGVRMEKATKILVDTNVVNVSKDLPRQEEEWLKR